MNFPWNKHRENLLGWWEERGTYLSLICLAFQNESCKLLWLLSINISRKHIFKLKNNTDRGISVHEVAMIKLQLKSHMKDYRLWCNGILKLSPPINNWTKHLTCLRKESIYVLTCAIQKSGFNNFRVMIDVTLWWHLPSGPRHICLCKSTMMSHQPFHVLSFRTIFLYKASMLFFLTQLTSGTTVTHRFNITGNYVWWIPP